MAKNAHIFHADENGDFDREKIAETVLDLVSALVVRGGVFTVATKRVNLARPGEPNQYATTQLIIGDDSFMPQAAHEDVEDDLPDELIDQHFPEDDFDGDPELTEAGVGQPEPV